MYYHKQAGGIMFFKSYTKRKVYLKFTGTGNIILGICETFAMALSRFSKSQNFKPYLIQFPHIGRITVLLFKQIMFSSLSVPYFLLGVVTIDGRSP